MKANKTGTTIAGLIYKDGVLLAADTRATSGHIIVVKRTRKLHRLAPNIVCAGAGTSADCDKVTDMIASEIELHRLSTGKEVPVCVARTKICQHLFRYSLNLRSNKFFIQFFYFFIFLKISRLCSNRFNFRRNG